MVQHCSLHNLPCTPMDLQVPKVYKSQYIKKQMQYHVESSKHTVTFKERLHMPQRLIMGLPVEVGSRSPRHTVSPSKMKEGS